MMEMEFEMVLRRFVAYGRCLRSTARPYEVRGIVSLFFYYGPPAVFCCLIGAGSDKPISASGLRHPKVSTQIMIVGRRVNHQ